MELLLHIARYVDALGKISQHVQIMANFRQRDSSICIFFSRVHTNKTTCVLLQSYRNILHY